MGSQAARKILTDNLKMALKRTNYAAQIHTTIDHFELIIQTVSFMNDMMA